MPLFTLDKELIFPFAGLAEPDGLLAIGGDLSTDRLLLAYRSGIFPWYEGEHILWWSPDPRFILFPEELFVSKSMKSLIRKQVFTFTVNQSFRKVIDHCKKISRKDQNSTWITEDMYSAYLKLHEQGYAYSAEAWLDGELAGGLYGIRLGDVFYGESMFTKVSNASKFAFINYVAQLRNEGVRLIDCQVYTEHLESLGARMIGRNDFLSLLKQHANI